MCNPKVCFPKCFPVADGLQENQQYTPFFVHCLVAKEKPHFPLHSFDPKQQNNSYYCNIKLIRNDYAKLFTTPVHNSQILKTQLHANLLQIFFIELNSIEQIYARPSPLVK